MEKSNSNSAVVWTIVIIIVLIIIGAIIYYDNSSPSATPVTTTTSAQSSGTSASGAPGAQAQSGAPMIPYYTLAATTSPTIGAYLVAANGMTLYTYDKDVADKTNCTGACATAWPPYTVSSDVTPTMSTAVTGHVAFITRPEGTTQVTYNGMPLYFYASDVNPGDVNGNNVGGFAVARP